MSKPQVDNTGKIISRSVGDKEMERNCGIHDFTTKDPKKWAEHIGNTPGHVDFGAAPCVICGAEVNYKSRGFNKNGEREAVMCKPCEEKAVKDTNRLGRSESGNVGLEFVNEVAEGKRKLGGESLPQGQGQQPMQGGPQK